MLRLPLATVGVPADLAALNDHLETLHPTAVLRWGWEALAGSLCATSSFQTQSAPLLHMIAQAVPGTPVLFLDTGFHFPETLRYRDELVERLGLRLVSVGSRLGHAAFLQEHGQLYRRDPDLCCYLNKVEPLERALKPFRGWVAGVRRDQTDHRRNTAIAAWTDDGTLKLNPMATWTDEDVQTYIRDHELPEHPLSQKGYHSIGCAPCTRPVRAGEDLRAGRWAGVAKTECGLHLGPAAAVSGASAPLNATADPATDPAANETDPERG